MDDFETPTAMPADDPFAAPADDMDMGGGAPPLGDASGMGGSLGGSADFGSMDMGGAPPLADAGDMGGMGDFGGAPPLDGGNASLGESFSPMGASGGDDAFGIGGGPASLGGSTDGLGMGGLGGVGDAPPADPMGGMNSMGGMDSMGMGGMNASMDSMGGGMGGDMGGGIGGGPMGGSMGSMSDMGIPAPSADEPLPVFGDPPAASAMPDFSAPTMGPLAEWRMAQDKKIEAKAKTAAEALAAARAAAAADIEKFYAERKAKSEKRASANRETEAAYIQERDASMLADSWESVCKLVDLKEKEGEKDNPKKVDRMRGLLFKLKSSAAP